MPGSIEFSTDYHRWLKGDARPIRGMRFEPQTFDDLISRYYSTAEWSNCKASTKKSHRSQIEKFRKVFGSRKVTTMETRHIKNLIDSMKGTPVAANNLRKRLHTLFAYAVLLGWRKDNPAVSVKAIKVKSRGFPAWSKQEIAQFQEHFPIGSKPRLAFDLALYTAQRLNDVRLMGAKDMRNGWIRVVQQKTDKTLDIPLHVCLAESLAATQTGEESFIVSSRGTPFAEGAFGNWFKKQCRAAGIMNRSMHGLRKAAANHMAECGLSNAQIKSITGHSNDAEIAHYTAEANQRKMAEMSISILNLANLAD